MLIVQYFQYEILRFMFWITGDASGLIAALLIAGFLQGPLIPAISSFAAPWFPTEERGRVISIIFMGVNVCKKFNKILHHQNKNKRKTNFR